MKKIFPILLVVAVFSVMIMTCSAAYIPYSVVTVDNLVETSSTRSGITVPKNKWDLSEDGTYTGTFEYSANVYGNYLLKTTTGTINATVTSESSGPYFVTEHKIELIKKKMLGTTSVAEKSIARDGTSDVSFTNLSKDQYIYFVAFSKAADTITLTGSFSVTE